MEIITEFIESLLNEIYDSFIWGNVYFNFTNINFNILKSTVDWCEHNYAVTKYVAEYWNTLSGISLIVSGLYFYINNKEWIQISKFNYEIRTVIHSTIWVGIGTMLFHMTLKYPFQLVDELSMLFLANNYLYLLLKLYTTRVCIHKNTIKTIEDFQSVFPIFVIALIFSYFRSSILQIGLFHLYLKVFEVSIIVLLYSLSKGLNKVAYFQINQNYEKYKDKSISSISSVSNVSRLYNLNKYKNHTILNAIQIDIKGYVTLRKELSKSIKIGLFFYITSLLMWVIENNFCDYVESLQLHAIWHVLSSIGLYHLNNIIKTHIAINNIIQK